MSVLGVFVLCLVTGALTLEKEEVDCWRGEQCSTCLHVNKDEKGNDYCCQDCVFSGFKIGQGVCKCYLPKRKSASSSRAASISARAGSRGYLVMLVMLVLAAALF